LKKVLVLGTKNYDYDFFMALNQLVMNVSFVEIKNLRQFQTRSG